MPKGSRTTVIVIMILILFGWIPILGGPVGAVASPLCVDLQSSPVLQDSGWRNFTSSYSGYTTIYDESTVLKEGPNFVMYVREENGTITTIYRGTSLDGIHWNIALPPVLTTGPKGAWDEAAVLSPDVVWNGTGYLMYYVGDGVTNRSTFPANFRQIGVAFSSDGFHWTKYANNPVITHGPSLYDQRFNRGPNVVVEDGIYKMWYYGTSTGNQNTPQISTIDFATSADGVHWKKYDGNPIFMGFTEVGFPTVAHSPSVVKVNGTYAMAFSDAQQNIGFATSNDGLTWRFDNKSNILVSWAGWHNGFVGNPSLLIDGQKMLLWYSGYDNSNLRGHYVGGIGFARCGLLLVPPVVTTTRSVTSVFVLTKSVVSTSISTSILPLTMVSTTTVGNPNAISVQVATAGVVGFAAAVAIAVSLIALKIRSRRVP